MTSYQRRVVIPGPPASSTDIAVWLISRRAPKVKNPYCPHWVPKEDIPELRHAEELRRREARRDALVHAARSLGMTAEASTYLGVPVKAIRGRRPGSPSRRRRTVIEGPERARIAREVQHALGDPQIYEKLEHTALEKAGLQVGKRRNVNSSNDFKIVDTCYREYRNKLQSERAFRDWDEWLKGYTAHVVAKVGSGKSATTRPEALKFYRTRLLNQIKGLVG